MIRPRSLLFERRGREKAIFLGLLILLLSPDAALAHDSGLGGSVWEGFTHPVTGVDHLTAMIVVGVVSYVLGGRAVWTLPATFVLALVVGGAFGFDEYALRGVEYWIVGSLIVLGLVVALRVAVPAWLVYVGVAVFGFAHGNAHGLELPLATSALGYASGFAAASAVCHITGIAIGKVSGRAGITNGIGVIATSIGVFLLGAQLA